MVRTYGAWVGSSGDAQVAWGAVLDFLGVLTWGVPGYDPLGVRKSLRGILGSVGGFLLGGGPDRSLWGCPSLLGESLALLGSVPAAGGRGPRRRGISAARGESRGAAGPGAGYSPKGPSPGGVPSPAAP